MVDLANSWTESEAQASYAGEICAACGERKMAGRAVCRSCWSALPGPSRWAYPGVSGANFLTWFRQWVRHLQLNPTRAQRFVEIPGGLPYRTVRELEEAGYKISDRGQCGSVRCLAELLWVWTPSRKKLPLDAETLQPHALTCRDPEWRGRRQQRMAQVRRDRAVSRPEGQLMALMTQKQYATRKKVSAQYISKLVSQGKIKRVGRQIDSRQADEVLRASKAVQQTSARAKAKRKSRKAKPEKPPSATRSYISARAEREHYQALSAGLEYKRMAGQLLPAAEVLEAERRKNGNIRTSFRRLARSLAPLLARATSPAEAEQLLLGEIDLVLSQLARDPMGLQEAAVAPEPESETPAPDMPPPSAEGPSEMAVA